MTSLSVQELIKGIEGVHRADEELSSDNAYIYSLGCPPVDIPLGGGLLSGRIYEFFGENSHGKSTFALCLAKTFCDYWASKHDDNHVVLWVESESTFDKVRASYFGCNLDKFCIYETDVFEDGRDVIANILKRAKTKGTKVLIVWDTIAATSTRNEKIAASEAADSAGLNDLEDEKEKKESLYSGGMVEKPRLLKRMLRDITIPLADTDSTLVLLNQVVTQIGKYGAPLDSSGGHGLKHFCSVRARVSKIEAKEIITSTGIKKIKTIQCVIDYKKNKITGLTLSSEVKFDLETGLNAIETRLDFMKKVKILPQAGAGWTTTSIPSGYFNPKMEVGQVEIKFQGMKGLEKILPEHPHLLDWWDYQIYNVYCSESPLIKIRFIEKLWDYEIKFFGKKMTELTEREKAAASLVLKAVNESEEAADKPKRKKKIDLI